MHETRQEQLTPTTARTLSHFHTNLTSLSRPLEDYFTYYCVAPSDASHDHTPITHPCPQELSRKQACTTRNRKRPTSEPPVSLFRLCSLPLPSPSGNRAMAPRGNAHAHDKRQFSPVQSPVRQPTHPCISLHTKDSHQPGSSLPATRLGQTDDERYQSFSTRKGEP